MLEGVARGGPLDDVKLSAGNDWSGTISSHHNGRYVWEPIIGTWVWKEQVRKKLDDVKPLNPKPKSGSKDIK